jgi:hypothetical protein
MWMLAAYNGIARPTKLPLYLTSITLTRPRPLITDKMLPIHLYMLMYSCKMMANWVESILPPCDLRYAFAALYPQLTLLKTINSPIKNMTSEITINKRLLIRNLLINGNYLLPGFFSTH